MSKYSYEFKLSIVKEYLNGEGSLRSIMKKHNMTTKSLIQYWLDAYEQ